MAPSGQPRMIALAPFMKRTAVRGLTPLIKLLLYDTRNNQAAFVQQTAAIGTLHLAMRNKNQTGIANWKPTDPR